MAVSSPALVVAAALLGAVLFTGCKQAEGERCEVDSDCQAGLTCNNKTAPFVNGQCEGPSALVDAGQAVDTSPSADGADSGGGTDARPTDVTPSVEAGDAPEAGAADRPSDAADAAVDAAVDAPADAPADVAPDAPAGG